MACAEGTGLREVCSQRAFTQLGAGLSPSAGVPRERVEALAVVVGDQAAAARAAGAGHLRVVATAALRRAPDVREVCARVRAHTGCEVEVLSPAEEARLAWRGATGMLPAPPAGPVAVVDVGGGSTEGAVGTAAGLDWWASAPIGAHVLLDAHVAHDPPTTRELAALAAAAREALAAWRPPPAGRALAVGGSATSLRRLAGPRLDAPALAHALGILDAAPAVAVGARERIDPRRVRLLPAGLALLSAAGERLGVPLEIADGGLREGVLLEALAAYPDAEEMRR